MEGREGGREGGKEGEFEGSKFRRDENPGWTGGRGRRGKEKLRKRASERARGREIALHAASWERRGRTRTEGEKGEWSRKKNEVGDSAAASEGVDGSEKAKGGMHPLPLSQVKTR